jgi:hypothetical protein
VAPPNCGGPAPIRSWVSCASLPFGPPSPGTTYPCVDTCSAILSGQPYVAIPTQTMCQ